MFYTAFLIHFSFIMGCQFIVGGSPNVIEAFHGYYFGETHDRLYGDVYATLSSTNNGTWFPYARCSRGKQRTYLHYLKHLNLHYLHHSI